MVPGWFQIGSGLLPGGSRVDSGKVPGQGSAGLGKRPLHGPKRANRYLPIPGPFWGWLSAKLSREELWMDGGAAKQRRRQMLVGGPLAAIQHFERLVQDISI